MVANGLICGNERGNQRRNDCGYLGSWSRAHGLRFLLTLGDLAENSQPGLHLARHPLNLPECEEQLDQHGNYHS